MGFWREVRRAFSRFHKEDDYFSHFERIASLNSLADVAVFDELKKALGPKPGKILDFGCGIGYVADFLGGEGVDVSRHAVDEARRRFPKRKFHVKTIAQLADWKQVFDVIVCINVIEHLVDEQREKFFNLAPDLLKKGGRICFVYDDMYHPLQLASAAWRPGTLLFDPTHEHCWTQRAFRRVLEHHFVIQAEKRANIQSMTLPWGNRFATAGLFICRPR